MPDQRSVTVKAPGKVNVQLAVGGRRDDGFHELATVFLAVSCYDDITVVPSEGLRVTVSGPEADRVPTDDSNLAAQAARLLAKQYGIEPNVHIHILKRIPVGGGMAGGSADGAGALVACNALWGAGADRPLLLRLAAELGSDVPFSLLGGAALGRGRGEKLEPLPVGAMYHWAFALSDTGLSTPAVFAEHDRLRATAGLEVADGPVPRPRPSAPAVQALANGDVWALGAALQNELEPAAMKLRPSLVDTLKAGVERGALGGVLCGTGASCAFLTANEHSASRLATALQESGTCSSVRTAHGPVAGPAPV
ncbi:4-(cytidine 5'-diphospho)-2-C-methyl-D-erythritol kinase [Streptomyces sp. IMTB 2501]|uniref:4-(cytidine 5'-diphospho)-2-C-methyl-D-erythritol kinase n=1 Tax=Streptomyces sp. IMTB 2501 TaxID=1776340 RepID=UPI00096ED234|nr:4-(cytidine 5'-diphospho)-2-C-methyl-D-erythritol kinase [Streptomyces sp. IMTB 2501]OLZ66446.1 4-(cytidine 5'-diphospho)-2-C-methyl-D-erythritol kinase [Streptomyces sp. IMTB 2501]